jgi:cytochrome d ubiquinol oxidase subunit II
MLVGIVVRGSAFVFRSYGEQRAPSRGRWERTFAVASAATPVLLGTVLGAIACRTVPVAAGQTSPGAFVGFFVTPWLAPFPLLIGLLTLVLVAQLAATYLTLATTDAALRDDFRRRALWSASIAAVLAAVAGIWFHHLIPVSEGGLLRTPRAWYWLVATALVAGVAIGALWRREYPLARFAGCAEVSLILWGLAVAQYPYLLPPTITIRSAAAPGATLTVLLWVLIGGAAVLIPSLGYLLKTFAARAASPVPGGP